MPETAIFGVAEVTQFLLSFIILVVAFSWREEMLTVDTLFWLFCAYMVSFSVALATFTIIERQPLEGVWEYVYLFSAAALALVFLFSLKKQGKILWIMTGLNLIGLSGLLLVPVIFG